MNIQQLRTVVAVAQTGSITKAAHSLFMSQPNLSKSLRELEEEIGARLFERTPQGATPTREGEAFLSYARSIVAQMDSLAALYQNEVPARLSLRVCAPRAAYAAHCFAAYAGSYAGTPLDICYRELAAADIIAAVAGGDADVGVLRTPASCEERDAHLLAGVPLTAEPLWEYDLVLLMDERHPLAGLAEVPAHLLAQYPQIVPDAPAAHGDAAPVQSCIAVSDRASQIDLLQAVKGSYAWASPAPFALLAQNGLVQKPCTAAVHCRDRILLPAGQTPGPVAQGFLDALRRDVQSLPRV